MVSSKNLASKKRELARTGSSLKEVPPKQPRTGEATGMETGSQDGPTGPDDLIKTILERVDSLVARVDSLVAGMDGLRDQLAERDARIAALTSTVATQATQIQSLSSAVEHLSNRVAMGEREREGQERRHRASNLIMNGLPELEGQGRATLHQTVQKAIPVDATFTAARLGRPGQKQDGRARPVLLTFPTADAKHSFLKHSRHLREKKIFLDDDLTPFQQRTRLGLREAYHDLKTQGKKPFWRGDKLLFRAGEGVQEYTRGPPPPPPPPAPTTTA
jgi:hypothetical protein